MKPHHRVRTLGNLKTICSVKLMEIEMQVERANAWLRDLEDRRADEVRALEAAHDGWQGAVAGRSLQLAAAAFWSAEMLRIEAGIDGLDVEIEEAEAARLEVFQARTAAGARCDAVDDLRRAARRTAQRHRDEAAMDAYAGRALTGWSSL